VMDSKPTYNDVVKRQRDYLASYNWAAKFDELDARLRNL
jgi:hypothetical protein